jgi:hypothetical protein
MFESLMKLDDDFGQKEVKKSIPKFITVELSMGTLLAQLSDISSLSDSMIQDIIYRQYDVILNYDMFLASSESRAVAQGLFTNERFLSNLVACANNLDLNEHQVICCNKLAYDYIALHSATDCNQVIRDLLMELSFRVNLKTVLALSSIIGLDNAKYLAMLRKSSFKENKNVMRVNRFLIKSGLELIEQNMIDIYCKMFDSVSILFTTTMFSLPEPDYTKLELFRYEEMSKAMIDLIDSMPIAEMKIVLSNYASSYSIGGEPKVRFSMKNIHESYIRINKAIEELLEDGIIVP